TEIPYTIDLVHTSADATFRCESVLRRGSRTMSVNVKVYDNGDHTCLVWLPADKQLIKDCRGFTIRKVLNGAESFLHGFAKFTEQDPDIPDPAWTRPLQRYMW